MNQEAFNNFIEVFEDYDLKVFRDGMTGDYYLGIYQEEKLERETFRVFKLKEVLEKYNN